MAPAATTAAAPLTGTVAPAATTVDAAHAATTEAGAAAIAVDAMTARLVRMEAAGACPPTSRPR